MARDRIAVRGARQNNLRDIDIDLPLGELIVITGGKVSSCMGVLLWGCLFAGGFGLSGRGRRCCNGAGTV